MTVEQCEYCSKNRVYNPLTVTLNEEYYNKLKLTENTHK